MRARTRCQALKFWAERLTNHDTAYGPEVQRELADVNAQADKRYQTERRQVDAVHL